MNDDMLYAALNDARTILMDVLFQQHNSYLRDKVLHAIMWLDKEAVEVAKRMFEEDSLSAQ